ncbi:pyrin isoform X3 [Choloepus didactylus]|uniref:pyrin isoform X3 n=1 Tax=Choloepus didactylus TaxID=27675 RepID=UPI00189EBA97|nr:pyrin isoform X3 [Choloepus didactylus]
MAKTPSDHLLFSLEELVPYDFEKFKFKLQNTSLEKEQPRIPRGLLQMAGPVKVASLLINHYGEEYALRLTMQVLRAINQRLLAEELLRAAGQECPLQEGVTDSSATSCSSGETKPKSLKIPDGPESSGQQQRGNGSPSLLSSQPEAEKGSQKRYPGKRREEKGSEGPEGQGKQGARGTTRISRRNIFLSPGRVPWEKEKESPRLRRNAFSSSGLSELSIRSFSGSLGRTAIRKSETHLPSGKKRPKSLEFAIPSGERGPPNSETLLMQDGTRISPDSTAIPRKVATLYVEATVAPEQGSRNPEVAVTLEGLAFKNTLDNASQTGEKTWGHTESTDHSKENGIGSPEAPVPLGEMVDSALHGPANPQVFPSLGRKGSQNPEDPPSLQITAYEGRPQDTAAYSFCQAQEGDQVCGPCVHGSCSCSVASGDSGGHSSSCPLYQAPLPRQCSKSREQPKDPQVASLGSDPPPQCERHMKQPRLLFCEDHREAVCLICSLSQEHRGHQVRPIEEVAFECKEQIKRQLEHLKDLKKYGEEQKSEGDKETANFLFCNATDFSNCNFVASWKGVQLLVRLIPFSLEALRSAPRAFVLLQPFGGPGPASLSGFPTPDEPSQVCAHHTSKGNGGKTKGQSGGRLANGGKMKTPSWKKLAGSSGGGGQSGYPGGRGPCGEETRKAQPWWEDNRGAQHLPVHEGRGGQVH